MDTLIHLFSRCCLFFFWEENFFKTNLFQKNDKRGSILKYGVDIKFDWKDVRRGVSVVAVSILTIQSCEVVRQ